MNLSENCIMVDEPRDHSRIDLVLTETGVLQCRRQYWKSDRRIPVDVYVDPVGHWWLDA